MALSTLDLQRLRRDLGDISVSFTDPELQDNYKRLSSAPSESVRFEAVKGMCFEQLLNSASKLHDFTAGAVGEKLSQVVANLEARYQDYKSALEEARGQKKQMVIAKMKPRRHPTRTEPNA